MVGVPGPQVRFTPQEDHDILRLRAQGFSWRLTDGPISYSASNDALGVNDAVDRLAAKQGCDALLRRQLETGQYSGAARQVWLDRHGVA